MKIEVSFHEDEISIMAPLIDKVNAEPLVVNGQTLPSGSVLFLGFLQTSVDIPTMVYSGSLAFEQKPAKLKAKAAADFTWIQEKINRDA